MNPSTVAVLVTTVAAVMIGVLVVVSRKRRQHSTGDSDQYTEVQQRHAEYVKERRRERNRQQESKAVPLRKDPHTLVIGSREHSGVDTAQWDDNPFAPNVADYDVIVIDTSSLGSIIDTLPQTFGSPVDERESLITRNVESIAEDLIRILCTNGQVFAIASPESTVSRGSGIRFWNLTNYDWCPCPVEVVEKTGRMIGPYPAELRDYLEVNKSWRQVFPVPTWTGNSERVLKVLRQNTDTFYVHFEQHAVVRSRAAEPVSIRLQFSIHEVRREVSPGGLRYQNVVVAEPARSSSSILVLPSPSAMTNHEAVKWVLQNLVGIPQQRQLPEWLDKYDLPDVAELITHISSLRTRQSQLGDEIDETNRRIEEHRRFRALLYEKGEEALEPIVLEALTLLGATVLPPAAKGREDGILIHPDGRRAVLEITGTTGSLGRKKVDQVVGKCMQIEQEDGWRGKGIIIVNWECTRAPRDRGRVIANPETEEHARLNGICILTSVHLYKALERHQSGKLGDFWERVFDTAGLFRLPYVQS